MGDGACGGSGPETPWQLASKWSGYSITLQLLSAPAIFGANASMVTKMRRPDIFITASQESTSISAEPAKMDSGLRVSMNMIKYSIVSLLEELIN
jgi:hypothetical protein